MSWIVYVLMSQESGRFYVGCSNDLDLQFAEHNQGQTKSTRFGRLWKVVHQEEFTSKSAAMVRERQIKSWKSSRSIQELIDRSTVEHPGAPGGS